MMGTQKFNLASKCSQNVRFLVPDFVFLEENFLTRNKFLAGIFDWGGQFPSPCHNATAGRMIIMCLWTVAFISEIMAINPK